MENIKTFNKNLNASYNNDIKFKRWEGYRNKLMAHILSSDITDQRLLIIGAGNLNDIDVACLLSKTKNISLLDIDAKSIEAGLKRQNIKAPIQIIELDLTNLDSDAFMDEFSTSLLNVRTDDFFKKYNKHVIKYDLDTYDRIIVLPIYTQILLHQMLALSTKDPNLSNTVLSFVGQLLCKINDQIIGLLKEEGKMIVLSDVLEYKQSATDLAYVEANISNKKTIDAFYESYLNKHGYSLGSYGLYDIEMKLKYSDDAYFLWHFDEERTLLVRGVILQ